MSSDHLRIHGAARRATDTDVLPCNQETRVKEEGSERGVHLVDEILLAAVEIDVGDLA